MRNLKRLLTLVMAIAMMMSLMVVGAGAAFKDQDKIENTDAVNMNVALGIINGRDDGSFDPAGNVTRAEMAKMICVLLNGGKAPTLSAKATPVFTDIKGHWGEGYIEYCASLGIIAGMGDGTFAPDKTVTATQAAKMLLVALGYDASFEAFNGPSWSVKIGVAANQKDLYDELAIDPNAPLNRDDAAQMIWNALQADQVKYEYSLTTVNGQLMNVQKREDKTGDKATLLADKFGTFDTDNTTALMTGISYNSTSEKFTYNFSVYDKDGKLVDAKYPSFTTKLDFTQLFGHNVCVVAKATNDVYGMYADDSTVIFSGVMDDVDFAKAKDSKPTVEFNDKDYDLSVKTAAQTIAFNGAKAVAVDTTAPGKAYFQVSAIDNTDDGKIDLFVYYPVTWGQVTYVGKDYIRVDGEVGKQLYFDDYEVYKGVAKDDYVMLNENGLVDDVVTKLDEVSGKLTNIAKNTVTIDGKKYSQVALADKDKLASGNLNDTFKFVAINGYLVKQSASDVVNLDEMLMVASVATGTNANGGIDAKVYFTDGTSKVVSIKSDSPAKPALPVPPAESVDKGTVYKYEVSKGEYKLTKLTSTVKFGFDFAKNKGDAITWAAKNTGADYATIDTYRIADNAIVLAQDNNTTTYNLITGAKLSKVTDKTLKVYAYGVEENDTTGFNYVTFAVVSGTTSATSDRSYGFIMSNVDVSKNADKENVYTFDMWNGKEKVAMTTTGNATGANKLAKGDVISYSLNGDKIDDAIILDSAYATATYGAVLATDGKYVDILTNAAGNVERFKIDAEDTTVLYISKEDKTGDATGNIVKADKAETGVTTDFVKGGESYVANVLFINNDLLVIDVDNDIKGVASVTTTANTAAAVEALFTTYDKVTVDAALAIDEDMTVPEGKTLVLNSDATVEAGVTLTVNGTVNDLAKVKGEATAKVVLANDATTTAANTWYLDKGTKDTDADPVATNGVHATAAATTTGAVLKATYTYGTLGFSGANDVAAEDLTGWFK